MHLSGPGQWVQVAVLGAAFRPLALLSSLPRPLSSPFLWTFEDEVRKSQQAEPGTAKPYGRGSQVLWCLVLFLPQGFFHCILRSREILSCVPFISIQQ